MRSIGTFLLVIGVLVGIYALSMDTSVEVHYSSGNHYGLPERVNNLGLMNEKQNYLVFSGILTLVGTILLVSSSSKTSSKKVDTSKKEKLFLKALKYYKRQDYSSTIALLNQILAIDPADNKVLFNLACCYSLQHKHEAFEALHKAVKFGYNDFNKIREYESLMWLRTQPEYDDFVANNYTITTYTSQLSTTEDVISKLERLANLRVQGVITNEELEIQKNEILKNRIQS